MFSKECASASKARTCRLTKFRSVQVIDDERVAGGRKWGMCVLEGWKGANTRDVSTIVTRCQEVFMG
jgi:hypothetical protein